MQGTVYIYMYICTCTTTLYVHVHVPHSCKLSRVKSFANQQKNISQRKLSILAFGNVGWALLHEEFTDNTLAEGVNTTIIFSCESFWLCDIIYLRRIIYTHVHTHTTAGLGTRSRSKGSWSQGFLGPGSRLLLHPLEFHQGAV